MAPWRVAVVGVGRMGQSYAAAYDTYPDTELVALVDNNAERAAAACAKFSVPAHFRTVPEMLAAVSPQIVSVITPGAYFRDAVVACAVSPGMEAIQIEKPFGGPLAACDEMVDACAANDVLFCGGNMQVAMPEVQEMAARVRAGDFGPIRSASVHGIAGEYVGGGCQHLAVLARLSGMEVAECTAWQDPPAGLTLPAIGAVDAYDGTGQDGSREENGLISVSINGLYTLHGEGGQTIPCPFFADNTGNCKGVELHFDDALVRWDWAPPVLFV